MPRATTDTPIATKAARDRLAARGEPYWRAVEAGVALGYRKGTRGGSWLSRVLIGTKYVEERLGKADDTLPANGADCLDFREAQSGAIAWAARQRRVAAGLEPEKAKAPPAPYTVSDAIRDHLADLTSRGSRSVAQTRTAAEAHIIPALGNLAVGRLTREKLRGWHQALAAAAPRRRTKAGAVKVTTPMVRTDEDAGRRRRATANRVLTILKAALNYARTEGRVTCPADPWHLVKPFRGADAAKVRYLSDAESVRLVNACPTDFRALVTSALLTGCRYGELADMKVTDLDLAAGMVTIPRSKSGKGRHVVLTPEAVDFFSRMAMGKESGALLFERAAVAKQATRERPAEFKRVAWRQADQFRPMAAACEAARITPEISFHVLRHTHASRLAVRGVPMGVIAAQLGHADTRMTERHYAHLSPSYVADAIRTAFGNLGLSREEPGIMPFQLQLGNK